MKSFYFDVPHYESAYTCSVAIDHNMILDMYTFRPASFVFRVVVSISIVFESDPARRDWFDRYVGDRSLMRVDPENRRYGRIVFVCALLTAIVGGWSLARASRLVLHAAIPSTLLYHRIHPSAVVLKCKARSWSEKSGLGSRNSWWRALRNNILAYCGILVDPYPWNALSASGPESYAYERWKVRFDESVMFRRYFLAPKRDPIMICQ